ncbi:hypothetical protein [Rahnella aquatilis]|nr:hypothetical protein [Rahnella aquatilis]
MKKIGRGFSRRLCYIFSFFISAAPACQNPEMADFGKKKARSEAG